MDFNKSVLEKSLEQPVVVDFWAPWCGPCRILGPVIEQLAEEQSDKWTLVKVNTEEEYQVAHDYRIRSIPNVKMFYQGEVIAEFSGALPRTSIERWLEEHLPDERKKDLAQLLATLEKDSNEEGLEKLVAFAEANPDVKEAAVTAAQHLVFQNPERAKTLVDDIKMGDPMYDIADDVRCLSLLLTFEDGEHPAARALAEARRALEAGDLEQGIQKIIEATSIDKGFQDELPRKTAIALFRTLGDQHPLTKEYRWKFDMALY
jgi:putative thioredoxin